MSSFNNYQKSTLLKYRAGTSDDPYIDITETKEVIDSKIYTDEIPSIQDKILITSMFEVESDDVEPLTNSQYRVDYNEGVIYFNSSLNGESITYRYKGRGNHFISASRVWTKEENGNVLETLEGIIESSKEAIQKTEELIDLSERVKEAVEKVGEVEASGNYARQQGDYAKLEGDRAKQIVDTAGQATDIINQTRDYAEQIASEIETMVDDVEVNSQYAKDQGDYAKLQGDYAKVQGDGAKAVATGMVNRGSYNETTSYIPLNIVVYGTSVYQNIKASTGIIPTNTQYWVKLVETATSTTWDSIAGKPNIEGHIADQTNPHHVTAEQVGTYTKSVIDQKISSATPVITLIDSYTSTDKTKPPTADALRLGLETKSSLAKELNANVNLNTINTEGEYYPNSTSVGSTMTNKPSGFNVNSYFFLKVFRSMLGSGNIGKIQVLTSIDGTETRTFVRSSVNGTVWDNWMEQSPKTNSASTTVEGTVMLDDTTASTSKTKAPTADALRRAYELASTKMDANRYSNLIVNSSGLLGLNGWSVIGGGAWNGVKAGGDAPGEFNFNEASGTSYRFIESDPIIVLPSNTYNLSAEFFSNNFDAGDLYLEVVRGDNGNIIGSVYCDAGDLWIRRGNDINIPSDLNTIKVRAVIKPGVAAGYKAFRRIQLTLGSGIRPWNDDSDIYATRTFQKYKLTDDFGKSQSIGIGDANNLIFSGEYTLWNGSTNIPVSDDVYIKVERYDENYIVQTLKRLRTTSYYTRTMVNGVWSAWSRNIVEQAEGYAGGSIYVNPVTGNDSNTGAQEAPKKTIQAALDSLPKNLRNYASINLLDGYTYNESINIKGFYGGGGGQVSITGSANTTVNGIITCDMNTIRIYMGGFNFTGITCGDCAHISLNSMKLTNPTQPDGITAWGGGLVTLSSVTISNCTRSALYAYVGGTIYSSGMTGSNNLNGYWANYAGTIIRTTSDTLTATANLIIQSNGGLIRT